MLKSVCGIGVDIVDIRRVARLLKRYPQRLPKRILHPEEQAVYQKQSNRAAWFARQFAAKEAVSKALGCGFRSGCYPWQILVKRDESGRPVAQLQNDPASSEQPLLHIQLSIADEKHYAIAQALIFKG